MVAALNFRAKKGFGPFASIPTASQHVPFSAVVSTGRRNTLS
jgi:hypothetical protein